MSPGLTTAESSTATFVLYRSPESVVKYPYARAVSLKCKCVEMHVRDEDSKSLSETKTGPLCTRPYLEPAVDTVNVLRAVCNDILGVNPLAQDLDGPFGHHDTLKTNGVSKGG